MVVSSEPFVPVLANIQSWLFHSEKHEPSLTDIIKMKSESDFVLCDKTHCVLYDTIRANLENNKDT